MDKQKIYRVTHDDMWEFPTIKPVASSHHYSDCREKTRDQFPIIEMDLKIKYFFSRHLKLYNSRIVFDSLDVYLRQFAQEHID